VEHILAGDGVWACDLSTGAWELRRVIETYVADYVGEKVRISVAGERIESTRHHPFWVVDGKNLDERPRPDHVRRAETADATVTGRWVDAGDLQVSDVVLLRSGSRAPIDAIDVQIVVAKVYNFQVEGLHNYAVGLVDVLVHNNAPCGSYTNTHASGTTYSGKGPPTRMDFSAAEKAAAYQDPVVAKDWTAAASDEDAFVQEALRIRANGGPGGNTYNKINSPGESILNDLGL
jgi:hypothetical protein